MSKFLKAFVLIAGLLIAVTAGIKFVQDSFRLDRWKESSELESTLDTVRDSSLVFVKVDERDFVQPPYPQAGDTLLTLDGKKATVDTLFSEVLENPPGSEFKIEYKNTPGDDTLRTVIRTIPVPTGLSIFVFSMFVVRILIAVGFIVTGFWAFNKQSGSVAVRALSLFCFSMASMVVVAFRLGYEYMEVFDIPGFGYIMQAVRVLFAGLGAFWLHLQLLFPRPRKFVRSHPLLTGLLIYFPIVAILIISAFVEVVAFGIILLVIIFSQIITGFVFLISHSIKTRDNLEKRQARLVLWGTGTGIFSLIGAVIVVAILRDWLLDISVYSIIGIFLLVLLALLLSPISFIYAFGKYRLLEVEGRIKRGTRYIAVTAGLLALFFAVLYVVSGFLISRVGGGRNVVIPGIALILAAGFAPAHRRVQSVLEKRIYPERFRLRMMLKDFLSGALAITDSEEFWSGIESRLKDALKVEWVFTVLDGADELMVRRDGDITPFAAEGEFALTLRKQDNRPLMLDEVIASGAVDFSNSEKSWLEEIGVAMALPLVTRGKLIGFIAIGFKLGRDDFDPVDIEMLRPLISQVAVTAENLRLMKENLEKQRLENELSVARRVQEGLLPRSIPETPGLELAGRSLSCLEVAGDYYDIIKIDQSRTVLAIGDVSGKGAGAAMLMSNLQASIRTAVRIGSDLPTMMKQINDLIYDNTESHQFITFFAGVFDARSSKFTYVNAGHNPPLAISPGGKVRELYRGGLILGAMPGQEYEQEEITLSEGDLVFLYTDGLSEAENGMGEMYGEERVRDFVVDHRNLSVDRLLDSISEDAATFSEGIPARDDLTLLAGKVTG
jgi:serine phosphatase RsbU (regulator of sigma subunit)